MEEVKGIPKLKRGRLESWRGGRRVLGVRCLAGSVDGFEEREGERERRERAGDVDRATEPNTGRLQERGSDKASARSKKKMAYR